MLDRVENAEGRVSDNNGVDELGRLEVCIGRA
jgi:hypothetical protein